MDIFIALGFIVLVIIYSILITTVNMGNERKKCDERGVPHVWVYEQHSGREYMMCADCKYIPSVDRELRKDEYDSK